LTGTTATDDCVFGTGGFHFGFAAAGTGPINESANTTGMATAIRRLHRSDPRPTGILVGATTSIVDIRIPAIVIARPAPVA
jgi:hypothetical protein